MNREDKNSRSGGKRFQMYQQSGEKVPFQFDPDKGVLSARLTPLIYHPSTGILPESEIICNRLSSSLQSMKRMHYGSDMLKYIHKAFLANDQQFTLPGISYEWEKALLFIVSILTTYEPDYDCETFTLLFKIFNEILACNDNVPNEQKKILAWKILMLKWYDNPCGDLLTFTKFMGEYKTLLTRIIPQIF